MRALSLFSPQTVDTAIDTCQYQNALISILRQCIKHMKGGKIPLITGLGAEEKNKSRGNRWRGRIYHVLSISWSLMRFSLIFHWQALLPFCGVDYRALFERITLYH